MSRLSPNLQRVASVTTRWVGRRWGEEFPFYYVMEYPKSGGSWLADMIADYLEIPRPVQSVFPIGCTAVLHGHWPYHPDYRRVFYLHRDGRDCVVSMYFRAVHELRAPPHPSTHGYYRKVFPSLFDPALDAQQDVRAALPGFVRDSVRRFPGTRQSWSEHVAQWRGRPGVVCVSYEELLKDAAGALARIMPAHTGEAIDEDRLARTVHKYSFEQQTGRVRGTEVREDFIRKGVSGDWRNHFTRAAGRAFDEAHGETLLHLDYEADRRWFESLPET